MKKIYLIAALSLIMNSLFSQDFVLLEKKLAEKNIAPRERVDLLLEVIDAGKNLNPDSLLVFAEEAYFLAQENHYLLGKAKAAIDLTDIFQRTRDFEQANDYLSIAALLVHKHKFTQLLGEIHYHKAISFIYQPDFKRAQQELNAAENYIEFLNPKTVMRIYNNLANIYFNTSNYAAALDYYLKQKTIAEKQNDLLELGFCCAGIGNIYNYIAMYEEAEEYYLKSIEALSKSRKPYLVYSVKSNLGTVYSQTDQPKKARKLYEELLQQALELKDTEGLYIVNNNFGLIEMNSNKNYTKALSYFNTALEYAVKSGDDFNIANALTNIGASYLGLEDLDNAYDYLNRGLQLADKIQANEISAMALKYLLKIKTSTIADPEVSDLITKFLEVQKKLGKDNTAGVLQTNQIYAQQLFDQNLEEIKLNEQMAHKDFKHQKRIIYFSIAFLVLLTAALCLLISFNKRLRKLRDSLQQKVNDSINQIRQQDSLLIVQNHQAAMGEMLSMIAHQWKQPLNSIAVIAQNIEDAYDYDELNRELIQKSVKDTMDLISFMSNTITSFRNYFIIGEEDQFSLSQSIELSLEYSQVIFKNYNISSQCYCPQDFKLNGQINLLVQVLLILINNSRDAFAQNQIPERTINISTSSDDNNQIVLIYEDNAGGIPDTFIDKIFEPYFSTKDRDKGTGIGLYIAKSIISKKFQGNISVNTNPPHTKFTLTFTNTK